MENDSHDTDNKQVMENKELGIWAALVPVFALIVMLAYNVFVFGDNALAGSNQFILLMGAAVAVVVGFFYKVSFETILEKIADNIKSTAGAILILLLVGALAGSWMISGIIPTMIYYGLQILNPNIFLAASLIICAIVSVATGSSWTTSATVGIALIGIANALNVPLGMTAGAILSGAYFGDKMSPLSDTTNLAPAMAGTDLFTHIRYMTYTTVPTILITLVVFIILGLNISSGGNASTQNILHDIESAFTVNPWLFIVPVAVIGLIIKKTPPLIALMIGTLLACIAALFFQPDLVAEVAGAQELTFYSGYEGIMTAMTMDSAVETANESLQGLFSSSGMGGMMNTVWLIICAMAFGGAMDAIGALARISHALLKMFHSIFGVFASTVFSCLFLNATASDQYLAIVVPGKMFANAYRDRDLAPENLSRTLEDSGTVTSVLIPYNTGGAYHSGVLGVSTEQYIAYAVFNYLSPFATLTFAAFNIKIRRIKDKVKNK